LKTTGGSLSAQGAIEYTPENRMAHFTQVLFEDLRVDFVNSDATRALEVRHAQQAVALARRVRNAPGLQLQVDSLRLSQSQIGFVNGSAHPPYRLFMSDVRLELKNLSNQALQGGSTFQAQSAFMGCGSTLVSGGIRSTASPVDMNLRLQLNDARLTGLNPFLLAHLGVDVASGRFSVFTELAVSHGRVAGYLKPLVTDLKIYSRAKDQAKPFGKRVEMHVLQALAGLFKNRSTRQVATVTRISGATNDPKVGEWDAIRKLVGNGLVQGIRPGLLGTAQAPPDRMPGKEPSPGAPARPPVNSN
jgi:hypothetical protein